MASPQGFTVRVQSETLSAPGRVYYDPSALHSMISNSPSETRTMALCLGTRHCDGHVREECLRQVIGINLPWVVPFVIQLVGEYVIEIVNVVVHELPNLDKATFSNFVRQNPGFIPTTRRRVTSYWSCYHRGRFPHQQESPGYLAMQWLESLSEAAP